MTIKNRLSKILLRAFYTLCRFTPINNRIIAFESEGDFSDNSRALYDFLVNNCQDKHYQYIWLVHKRDSKLGVRNTRCVFHNYQIQSISDALILARAKYIFYTHGLGAGFQRRSGQVVVNLWHGIPIKAVKTNGIANSKPPFSLLLCLGEMNIPLIAKFLSCDEKYAIPLGYPRNDLLIKYKDIGRNNPFAPEGFTGKMVIWMPTFRMSWSSSVSEDNCDNETSLPLLSTLDELVDFNDFLCRINVCVIVKIHHLQAGKDAFKHTFTNIRFVQDQDILNTNEQLYGIVAKTDALLTVYSSIYFDYMLMDLPIGFILEDMEKYVESRGEFLYSPVTDLMPGSHIYNIQELKQWFVEIVEETDSYASRRHELAPRMIKYQDGNSCKRIIDYLGI